MSSLPTDFFARRLRAERERLGLSQAELARRIAKILDTNFDPSTVTRIEQQIRAVRLDEAVAAADALGIPLTVLVSPDPDAETEAQVQRYLVDLSIAQRRWEEARVEVMRISKIIETITGGTSVQPVIDPRLRDAADARVQVDEATLTDPDA